MSSEEKAGSAGAPSEGAPSQQPETPKPKPPRPANMKYHPGETIEAKDFDGKWYPAQISEIDWNDKEILVHFEKCDEWIQMDSSRLRHLPKPPQQPAVTFTKGEEVIAPWSSTRKYPATIQVVHANGRYDVLFHDGSFKTKLPGQKISKLDGQVVRNDIPNFTNIGTKEERRERKRKINIAELFHINKRSKKKGLVHSKSPDVKTYTVNRSRVKKTLPTTGETEATDVETEGTPAEAPATPATPKQPEAKPTTNVTPGHGSRNLIDTVPCPVQVTYKDGRTEMWSKHLYQRSEGRTAGKLDIVIMNPKGKKFRCRNEIMKYCEENKINYSPEAFDFSAKGRPKSKPVIQTPPAVPESPQIASSPEMEKPPHKKPRRKSHPEEPIPVTPPIVPASPVVAPPIVPLLPPPPVELLQGEAKIFIGDVEVRTDNGKLICPVKECSKHFRRENLLHMHMKHYHPEFSKFLDYTPSVTDLAYARTVGSLEPMDGPQQASRKSFGIEKPDKSPVKPENSRKSITAAADVVKESKKAAKTLEPKNEAKASPSTAPAVTSPIVEDRVEDNKAKIANDLLEVQKNSLLPESLPPTSPNNRISRVEESQNEQETETAPKTLPSSDENKTFQQKHRHRRSGRYQGPFSHHSRKRKYSMLAEQRRSNYKMAKKEPQTPPPPLPAPFSSPVPPHSQLEDQSNSNASSQSFPVARYQKQQSLVSNEISDHTEGTEDSKSPLTVENDKFEKLRRNEIINCCCGLVEEDGLMIQCDLCLCWQHGHCANILRDTDVPDKYICSICKNPFRGRLSMKYLNDQEWLKEGTLPRSKREDVINARKAVLKRSYDLSGSISLLAQVIYSLRVKLHIAEKKDHPKLWLWAKKWSEKKFNSKLKDQGEIKEERLNGEANGDVKVKGPEEQLVPKAPEPEAPIDSAECRLNLLDHLIHYQTLIDARLSCIESLVAELESVQEDAMEDETPDEYPRTKATVQMLLRDLNTVKKIAAIS